MTSKYEEKFMQEMDELRSRHARDLELAKTSLQDSYEQRIIYLKEQKEETETRLMKTEQ